MNIFQDYLSKLQSAIDSLPISQVEHLAETLLSAWSGGRQVFLCGNGGSAANAVHIANDLFYGITRECDFPGLRVHALSANGSIMTCLANDVSYGDVFSEQLRGYARAGDVLIALSGSGNSPNIVKAIEVGNEMGLSTFAVLGYSGGKCLQLAGTAIHFAVDDMQIAEDAQVMVGHMVMQWLRANPPQRITS